jgi:hypothetical protein
MLKIYVEPSVTPEKKMAVRMVFVGNHLEDVLDFMEVSTQESATSILCALFINGKYRVAQDVNYTGVIFPLTVTEKSINFGDFLR